MHRAMVLYIEEIGMSLENRHGFGILLYPSPCHENRSRNAVFHQHVQNAMICLAHAGIKRQRHLRCRRAARLNMQLRLDNRDRFRAMLL